MYADLAHLVERHLAKVEVAGSSPVIRSRTQKDGFDRPFCVLRWFSDDEPLKLPPCGNLVCVRLMSLMLLMTVAHAGVQSPIIKDDIFVEGGNHLKLPKGDRIWIARYFK